MVRQAEDSMSLSDETHAEDEAQLQRLLKENLSCCQLRSSA